MKDEALVAAIEAAGGTGALARRLGVTSSAVSQWSRVPAEKLAAVEAATGIPRDRLRPDLAPAGGFAEAQSPLAIEARSLGLDPAAIADKALRDAIRAEKARRWQEENREAIEAHNAWVEKHGVPLAKYRMF